MQAFDLALSVGGGVLRHRRLLLLMLSFWYVSVVRDILLPCARYVDRAFWVNACGWWR